MHRCPGCTGARPLGTGIKRFACLFLPENPLTCAIYYKRRNPTVPSLPVLKRQAGTAAPLKHRRTRVQPLTRGPEDDETTTMTVARPQHVCMPLSERRQHHPARSICAAAPVLRSSQLGADMVGKSRNKSADMLFMLGLLALVPPTICCERSQSVRDSVTEISGGATPAPVRCGSEL